jgi:hypothetical protein
MKGKRKQHTAEFKAQGGPCRLQGDKAVNELVGQQTSIDKWRGTCSLES